MSPVLASTILLRQLFTRRPTRAELNFYWWFVESGHQDWSRILASKGFGRMRRTAIIRNQEKAARKALETWDTDAFHHWQDTGEGRAIIPELLPPEVVPMLAEGDMDEEVLVTQVAIPEEHVSFNHLPQFQPDHWVAEHPLPELPIQRRSTLPTTHF